MSSIRVSCMRSVRSIIASNRYLVNSSSSSSCSRQCRLLSYASEFTDDRFKEKVVEEEGMPTIVANLRSQGGVGSKKSQKMRKEGLVPGVIYGNYNGSSSLLKINVTVDKKILMRELQRRKFSLENTLYNMVVTDNGQDNTTYIIVPRQLQVHPLTMEPISCNYLAYQKGQRMRIPIEFTNQDQNVDIKRGSFVLRISRYIEVQCFGDVPACINADVANISSGRSIKLNDLSFPRGVVPYKTVTPNFVAGIVTTGSTS